MKLGDLLVRAKLVTERDIHGALARSREHGGRLGENLLATGAITKPVLETFLRRIPEEPGSLRATGIDENDLLSLLIKLIQIGRLSSVREYISAIKLPLHVVTELASMAVDRRLLSALGTRNSDSLLDMSYALTEEGHRYAVRSLETSAYVGPAPVTMEEFTRQVVLQKPNNERIGLDSMKSSMGDLTVDISLLEQAGPALNSGRAILLYGPPGNGKTVVAMTFANVFREIIYVPYAITIEGQIIRFFDPALHKALSPAEIEGEEEMSFVRHETFDTRWVPCRRPFVIVGGELTLEMLDLRFDNTGHFYEAPLHMKALGGCFLIDDFGRQLVSPTALLNRWIVPLESRVDYLKLHTGKSFNIPFEETIIFSTNLQPEDLMDPAFLRRLPYKIEVGAPGIDRYREIFEKECIRQGMELRDDIFHFVVHMIREEKQMDLAAYQPRFIVDQVVATCRFLDEKPTFERRYVEYAVNNLRVNTGEENRGAPTSARV